MNGESIDYVFNALTESLSHLQQELKDKQKPSKKEIDMMDQLVAKAKADADQSMVDKGVDSLKQSVKTLTEYITLVEEERLHLLAGAPEEGKGGVDELEKQYKKNIYDYFGKVNAFSD